MSLFVTIVLDGVGIGAQDDADAFGDAGSDTLGNVCVKGRPSLPNMARLGLGCIRPLHGVAAVPVPAADFGMMREVSAGKDSTTGHWELAGITLDRPFPTYPEGFPADLVERFCAACGVKGVLGNVAASGTEIIMRLGDDHLRNGYPIVYTSADSVFQVAAHVDVLSLERLYEICEIAREKVVVDDHAVGRVIARPFAGTSGNYSRISDARKDFSLRPPKTPVQMALTESGVRTIAVGKIGDLFAGVGFTEVVKTKSNAGGITATLDAIHLATQSSQDTFVWTNLVDFDQEFGHRNDVAGFVRALEEFDRELPVFESVMPRDAVFVITADHGNDPTFPGTDHNREYVPLLVLHQESGRSVGLRGTFADHAASVAAYFGVSFECPGSSFIPDAVRVR